MELLLLNVLLVCPHLLNTKCLGYFPLSFGDSYQKWFELSACVRRVYLGMGFLAVTWFTGSPARLR